MPYYKRFEDIDRPGYYFATDIVRRKKDLPFRVVVRIDPGWNHIWYGRTHYSPDRYVDFTGPFVDELTRATEKGIDIGLWYERERATASPSGIVSGNVSPDNPLGSEPNR